MAYADVVSLMNTTRRLQKFSHISIAPSSFEILEIAYKEMAYLEDVLRRLDGNFGDRSREKKMDALDRQAREAVRKLEDILDSLLSNHITLSQSGREGSSVQLCVNSEQVHQEIRPITGLVKQMEGYFQELLRSPLPEDQEEEDDVVSSRFDHIGGDRSKVVGFSRPLKMWIYFLLNFAEFYPSCGRLFASLYGMAGIGKTTLAREVFGHPSISSQFDIRVWVTVGPKYTWKGIIRGILAQVDPGNDHKMVMKLGEMELGDYLNESLKGKRYLIVLDDVWDNKICVRLQERLRDDSNQSCVFVTTRLMEVAFECILHKRLELMDDESSWDLLREEVFGEARCPFQLEAAGKKIAENCEGLPLLIVQVAKLLSKGDKTLEYWNEVAEKQNSVFMDAHDQILDVLLPSYTYLPIDYKASFVYMGVFPHKYDIPHAKLINLWHAEGVHLPFDFQTSKEFSKGCLISLYVRCLFLGCVFIDGKKTCRLHSVFLHLCKKESGKNQFFHVLSKRSDSFAEGIRSQRRLCIHNNTLFGIKDVYDSMASISTARSLLCTGPYHQYPVPICFGLRLLKVLYALSIRFYEFPMDVLKLVLLRYLALTYDGEIPPSISKLWNLECFTVHRHLSIKYYTDLSYLPREIWDMKELKHLEITGCDLKDPCGAVLPNLVTLSGVSTRSCTESVLKGLPKLEKLRIRIVLELDATELSSCFDHISLLQRLETLKCVIVNPNLRSVQASITNFSSGLKRLTLCGFGYPWEYMRVIASLPNLVVLKVRSYAFRGPMWDMRGRASFGLQFLPTEDQKEYDHRFLKLQYLLIEDTDLVQWRSTCASFPSLIRLCIKHCYKLEQIPMEFVNLSSLTRMEVIDCSPSAVICAKQLQLAKYEKELGRSRFSLTLHSSWDDGNIKYRVEF